MAKQIKKITFLGNFEVDYCSEVHYKKTFEKFGIKVVSLQEGKTDAETILKNALTSDMFFWVHTHGWKTEGIEDVLIQLKKNKIPSVGYHLDLWKGLAREKDLETDPYWNIEYFFTCDMNFIPDLKAKGIKSYFLPAGVFEDECYIGKKRPEYEYDVIFVGSRGYHSEWPYREKLISWLEKTYGSRFAQFGGGGLGTVRGSDLNDLYASAKVVVGDTLCKGFNYPHYLSDRIFETTGRGGFIIHPYIKGIEDLFSKDELVTYPFNDFKYLKYCIDYYLKNDEEREQIRLAGHNRTKKTNTYTNRLNYILSTIQNER